ncbi:MAG: hypothetical protein RIQ56_473, partial [Candidatus Parcubacteria bacterium]
MSDVTNTTQNDTPQAEVVADPRASEKRPFRGGRGGPGGDRRGGRGQRPSRGGRDDRERSEFAQKMIGLRRVARVMAGGRRFNFSAALVLGDKKGRVGVGIGKAA